ncbi:MAG: cold shock domain-containing protein [Cyanobacteria bacterium P01_D01_bin.1]
MLKRLMIWLLNQIQEQFRKVSNLFNGGRDSVRSQNFTEAPTSLPNSSAQATSPYSDFDIDSVAPAARRVSLSPATSKREQQVAESVQPYAAIKEDAVHLDAVGLETVDSGNVDLGTVDLDTAELGSINLSSPSPTDLGAIGSDLEPVEEPDTHRRLDATAAAISGQESVVHVMANTVSDLIDSGPSLRSAVDDALPIPTVETQGNYQLPAIQDLLPAIEPDAPTHIGDSTYEESAIQEETTLEESAAEAEPMVEEFTVEMLMAGESTAAVDSLHVEIVEQVTEQVTEQTTEQAILFSFDIYESETATVYEIENTSKDNEVSELRKADEVLTVSEIEEDSGIGAVDISSASVVAAQEKEEVDEPEANNPWTDAIARKTQESTQTPSAAETVETETKPGVVKLLFTIKPGNYHGYIAPVDGSKDILFHQKYINADIFEKIERGTAVVATVKLMAGKAYATHVELSSELNDAELSGVELSSVELNSMELNDV